MFMGEAASFRVVMIVLILAGFLSPALNTAQEPSTATEDSTAIDIAPLAETPSTNPTGRLIYPRKNQSEEKQISDQSECYAWTCDQVDWDPYQAYADLVDQGYAVSLTWEEMERGLICLATRGAEIGAVADEMIAGPGNGEEIGAAIAVASGLIDSSYLTEPENPEARRVISRYERDLRKWERKFAGCLSRKGYQVPPVQQ